MPLTQPLLGFDDVQCGAFPSVLAENSPYDDMLGATTATLTYQAWWLTNAAGGNALFDALNVAGHPGVIVLHTIAGPPATNKIGLSSVAPGFPLADSFWEMVWLVQLPVLSAGGDTYTFRAGLGTRGQINAEFTDGVYIEYDSSVSPNWRGVTSAAGVRTKSTGTVAVTTNYTQLQVRGTGTSIAQFLVDGVEIGVGDISTNLPTVATINQGCQLAKVTGNADVVCNVDAVFFRCAFSGNR